MGQRDERDSHLPEPAGGAEGVPGRAGDAGHRRRPAVLAAVPQRPARPAGHDLRGPGSAELGRRQPAGAAARGHLGHHRLLRRRLLRRQHRPAVRDQVWLRGRGERVLRAGPQPGAGRREGPRQAGRHQRVRAQQAAARHQHAGPVHQEHPGRDHRPAVLPRGGRRGRGRRAGRGVLQAIAAAASRQRAAGRHRARRRPPGPGLAVGADSDPGVDDLRASHGDPAARDGNGRRSYHPGTPLRRAKGGPPAGKPGAQPAPAPDGVIRPRRPAGGPAAARAPSCSPDVTRSSAHGRRTVPARWQTHRARQSAVCVDERRKGPRWTNDRTASGRKARVGGLARAEGQRGGGC